MSVSLVSRILLVTIGIPAFTMNAFARQQKQFAATDTTAMVRGTVSDQAGSPLAGVKIVATAKIIKIDSDRETLGQDSTLTSGSGTYLFPALDLNSPGINGSETDYSLTFNKVGYRPYASNFELAPLKDGDSVTYDVRLARILDLTVIVGKAGAPESSLAGASVVSCPVPLMIGGGYDIGVINANGQYTFADIDSGAKSITVSLDGYNPAVVRKSVSELAHNDTVRILLEKSNPDSMRTLIVKLGNPAPFIASKDTMVFSITRDSLPMNLLAIGDSGVFTFRNIPGSYSSGALMIRSFVDTATLTGIVTQKTFIFHPGLSISTSPGSGSGSAKIKEILGPVPYYFDGRSGKSFNILGRPKTSSSAPADPSLLR